MPAIVAKARRALVGVVLPLVLGGAFYVFFRPRRAWFTARLEDVAVLGPAVTKVRTFTTPIGRALPHVVLDTAPDLAWSFALGALLAIVWRGRHARARAVWCVLGLAFALGYEVAQGWHLVPGTFDPFDLVAEAVGYVAGWAALSARSERDVGSSAAGGRPERP